MRLSEAIRLGSMMKPQCFEALHIDGGSCALGAAADAVGLVVGDFFMDFELETFAGIFPKVWNYAKCPACATTQASLAIAHLNDFHRWSREAIADFVETLEPPQPAAAAVDLSLQQVEA